MSSISASESFPDPEEPFIEEPRADVVDMGLYREEHDLAVTAVDLEETLGQSDNEAVPGALHPYFHDWQRVQSARIHQGKFEQLTDEHIDQIKHLASRYFINGANSDDVMQEALVGFYKGVRDYDGIGSSFRTFAELCIRRQLVTAIKTANRFKHVVLNTAVSFEYSPEGSDSDDLTLAGILPDPGRTPEEIVIGDETFYGLLDILRNELSYIEHSVLKMYIEGLSYEAMADKLDEDPKLIDNALQRVKRKVLAYLESLE